MNDNMNTNDQHNDMPSELALRIDRATGDVALQHDDWREPDEFELAAAAAAVAFAEAEAEELPDSLRSKLQSIAKQGDWKRNAVPPAVAGHISPRPSASHQSARAMTDGEVKMPPLPSSDRTGTTGSSPMLTAAGWLAAAAAIAIAAVGWMRPAGPGDDGIAIVEPASIEERLASLEAAPGTVSSDWFAWAGGTLAPENDPRPGAAEVSGRFVWNEARQEGYMVFENMPANDPTLEQYQLWLVSQNHENPIDGGVFDIASGDQTIVPIDPKLRASNLIALGVTVEKPGGVVVSSRQERMVASLVPQG